MCVLNSYTKHEVVFSLTCFICIILIFAGNSFDKHLLKYINWAKLHIYSMMKFNKNDELLNCFW